MALFSVLTKSVFGKQTLYENRLCICLKSGNVMFFGKSLFHQKKQKNTYSVSCIFPPVARSCNFHE